MMIEERAARMIEAASLPTGYAVQFDAKTESVMVTSPADLGFCVTKEFMEDHNDAYLDEFMRRSIDTLMVAVNKPD